MIVGRRALLTNFRNFARPVARCLFSTAPVSSPVTSLQSATAATSTVKENLESKPRKIRTLSTVAERLGGYAEPFEPELVVFDKDGTLIDFKFMWGKWGHAIVDKMEQGGHLDKIGTQRLEDALGYSRLSRKVASTSALCCTPMHEIEDICINVVASHRNLSNTDAHEIVKQVWHMPDVRVDTRALTDLPALFSMLRDELGLKIAVCTTDNRHETLETLKMLKCLHLVDIVLCGDEKHVKPKPSAEQLEHICSKLNVCPSKTIMVGDTVTDMKMARNAKVGLSIAIPNGAGATEDLMNHGDIILPDMNNAAKLIKILSAARLLR
jgi:phosphoglycolate phosphatase